MIPSEWTSKYWQWIHSHKEKDNPLKTGVINVTEDCYMLPCTGGGSCDRKAELAADKEILIPVFAAVEFGGSDVADRARIMARPNMLEFTVDGLCVDFEYIESKFKLGKHEAAAAGYWHRLKLPEGKHIVKFGGSGDNGFYTDNTYELNVV